jgi:hypothetical protein
VEAIAAALAAYPLPNAWLKFKIETPRPTVTTAAKPTYSNRALPRVDRSGMVVFPTLLCKKRLLQAS